MSAEFSLSTVRSLAGVFFLSVAARVCGRDLETVGEETIAGESLEALAVVGEIGVAGATKSVDLER